MEILENKIFDEERALYASHDILVRACTFDGPADGESALKESRGVSVENCFMNLRYPFWHNDGLRVANSEMTELCRAAVWYSKNITIVKTKLHGIKAMRECSNVNMEDCDICSPEFGWSVQGIKMSGCTVQSEYFMLRATELLFTDVRLKGKYSFQYIENAVFESCEFDTKDAFWHAKNVTVKNSIVKGEYLGWYSEGLTLENCTIIGTQPLCYAKKLKLIDCKMIDTDLAFEKSEVEATLISEVESIKNPMSGHIYAHGVKELIMDDENARGEVTIVPCQCADTPSDTL